MNEKDSKKTQSMENFLSAQILDEGQNAIPSGYEVVKKYPLHPPFSYANILYNPEKSNYLYFVDELKLNQEEKRIFDMLHGFVEESLESTSTSKEDADFEAHLNNVIKENEKMFLGNSIISMEKVKYYLKRNISGYGLID